MKFSEFFKNSLLLSIYILANSMFILKYGIRQDFVSVTVLILLYVFGCIGAYIIFMKLSSSLDRLRNFNKLFLLLGISAVAALIAMNLYVDPETLNVYRYRGLNTTISHILQGDYPYSTIITDRGETTSNLPALFYVGLPFYLLGDVGYLQVFVFGWLLYLLHKSQLRNSDKVLLFFLLLCSPAFMWEVYVKSDMMSNLFLLSFFINWWTQKNKNDYFKNPILLGFLVAFFALTRLIVIIPFLLMFFYPFFKTKFTHQIKFIGSLMISIILIASPILLTIPSWEVFVEFNPLNNQTGEAPWYLSLIFLILPMAISKYAHKKELIFMVTSILVFAVVLLRFLLNGFEEGFYRNVYESLFDISYFGLVIPFIFFDLFTRKNIMHA